MSRIDRNDNGDHDNDNDNDDDAAGGGGGWLLLTNTNPGITTADATIRRSYCCWIYPWLTLNFLRTRLSGIPWTKSAPKETTRKVVSGLGFLCKYHKEKTSPFRLSHYPILPDSIGARFFPSRGNWQGDETSIKFGTSVFGTKGTERCWSSFACCIPRLCQQTSQRRKMVVTCCC